MKLVACWLAVTCLGFLSQASSKNIYEYQLRAKLFVNYSKLVPPQPINTPVNVSFNIAFSSLKNMDVKKEEISINIWQRQYWDDYRLAWNSSKNGNITQITYTLNEIWTPDIYLYYSSGTLNKFGKEIEGSLPFNAVVYSNGHLFFSQPATIYAPCEVDVGFYPFDDQICKLTFGTWSQDASVVRMLLYKGGFDLANYINHNEWEIVSIKPSMQTVQLKSSKNGHATVVYTIHLRRHALFYMINYILPSIIIAILSLLLFLIPPEVGKRMEAGINLLLCLSVYLMLVNSKMPLSSKSFPLLTKFYGCTIMILVVSLCCTCWVYSYYFMNPSGWDVYHLPAVLEKVIFNCLGPAFNLPCKSLLLQPSSNDRSTSVKGYEIQALDEDQDTDVLQLKRAAEARTDQSKNEMIATQTSSSLVDGDITSIQVKEAFAEASTDRSKSEVITTKRSGSLVDGTKETADVITDQSQNKMIPIQRSSLIDGKKGGDVREKEESSAAACVSNQAEETRSSLDNEAISVDDKKEREDPKQGEESSSVTKDAPDPGHGEEEDGTNLDTSKKKKKKKKKKKNTSKLVRKAIAVQRVAKSFDQVIKETSRAAGDDDCNDTGHDKNLQEKEESVHGINQMQDASRDQDHGESNSDDTGHDNNIQEKEESVHGKNQIQDSSRGQDVGDDEYDNFGKENNLQEGERVTVTSVSTLTTTAAVPSDSHPNQNHHLLYLAQSSQQKDQKFENAERWKLAAIILDRLFIILLVLSIVASFLACFLISPRVRMGLV